MPFTDLTLIGADNAGNESDFSGWTKMRALIRAANAGQFQLKNKIQNAAMQVWQRGATFAGAATSGAYTADRWRATRDGATANTYSRQTGFSGARYCMRVQRDAGDTGTANLRVFQHIESADCYALQGKTIRISADARAGANFSGLSLGCVVVGGTGIDEGGSGAGFSYTGSTTLLSNGQAITTTAARISWPAVTVPTSVTELCVHFLFTPSGTAGAADYFELTNVTLEIVDATEQTATAFETLPFALDFAICLRAYRKSFAYATAPAQNVGINTGETTFPAVQAGATNQRGFVRFDTPMRAAPTITLYNPAAANAQVRDKTAGGDCSSSAAANATASGFDITATGNASTAVAGALGVHWQASADL